MKNPLIALCGALVFMLVSWLPCHGQGVDTSADLSQVYPQLSDMGEHGIPYSFQNRHNGNGNGSQEEAVVDIYVNCSTGRDKPGWGLSPEKPFETINYATGQIPFIRKSADFFVNIYVAQGTYYDVVISNCDNIGLIGEGSVSTFINILEGKNPITILTSNDILVDGFTIEDGSSGLFIAGSSFSLFNTTIRNNSRTGLSAGNSELMINNCTITGNNLQGILLFESSLKIVGPTSISSNHSGIGIALNSMVGVGGISDLTISENNIGIVVDSSSKLISGMSIISDNIEAGIIANGGFILAGETLIENNGSGISVGMYGHIEGMGNLIISDNLTTGLTSSGGDIDFNNCNATIIDNPDGDVSLSFGARAVFEGDTIGTLSCDETVLISGDMVCP